MLNYYTTDSVILPRPSQPSSSPDNQWGQQVKQVAIAHGYNVYSLVHTIALMLSVYVFSWLLIQFVLGGGLEGYAEDAAASGLSAWVVLLDGVPKLAIPIGRT